MFNFSNHNVVRTFIGAVGTLFFTSLALLGSAGPAVSQLAALTA